MMVLHRHQYAPKKQAFALLDQTGLNQLFALLAQGGWFCALHVPQLFLETCYKKAYGTCCPENLLTQPYSIPRTVAITIHDWLESQGMMVERKQHGEAIYTLNREDIAARVHLSSGVFRSSRAMAFFRQFEAHFHTQVLIHSASVTTEFPSHKTLTFAETIQQKASEGVINDAHANLRRFFKARQHLPVYFPESQSFSLGTARQLALKITRPAQHHPFMPVNTGLAYLNHAIGFVHLYGETIIDAVLKMATVVNQLDKKKRTCKPSAHDLASDAFNALLPSLSVSVGTQNIPIAEALGIQKYTLPPSSFRRSGDLGNHLTLYEALQVLVGACVICMAMLKPSREDEILHLKRNCLRRGHGGYYLHFTLGKSNYGEAYQSCERPIPVITAKAIKLLQQLGSGLADIYDEKRKLKNNLFYLPNTRLDKPVTGKFRLNHALDTFCDYVGLEPDTAGRRWYVHIHEMRKWFLLLFFWSGRFDVLDAARWIAGHTNARHLWAYIEANFPGKELPAIEAEYSVDRLLSLQRESGADNNDSCNEEGLDLLYKKVCQHFSVNSLDVIPESEWINYINTLRQENGFHLEPYSILAENGRDNIGLNIAFVLRETT